MANWMIGVTFVQRPRAHNKRTAEYLLGMPLLGDLLEEGLAQFGHSIEEFEQPV